MSEEDNPVYFDGLKPGQTKTQDNGIVVHRSECGNHFTWNQDGAACQLSLNQFSTELNKNPSYREIFEKARIDDGGENE